MSLFEKADFDLNILFADNTVPLLMAVVSAEEVDLEWPIIEGETESLLPLLCLPLTLFSEKNSLNIEDDVVFDLFALSVLPSLTSPEIWCCHESHNLFPKSIVENNFSLLLFFLLQHLQTQFLCALYHVPCILRTVLLASS